MVVEDWAYYKKKLDLIPMEESENMTREEAIRIIRKMLACTDLSVRANLNADMVDACHMAIKALEQEPTTKNDLGVDCIDRKATLNAIIKRLGIKNETYLLEAERAIYQQILAMSSITPQEPRKGHWIETAEEYYKAINEKGGGVNENTDYFVDDIACSECLAKFSVIDNETERFKRCPNCGADMRGEE